MNLSKAKKKEKNINARKRLKQPETDPHKQEKRYAERRWMEKSRAKRRWKLKIDSYHVAREASNSATARKSPGGYISRPIIRRAGH